MNDIDIEFKAYQAYIRTTNYNASSKNVEKTILFNIYYGFLYTKKIIQGRFPKYEKLIRNNPKYCFFYTLEILKKRVHKYEKVILNDIEVGCLYAAGVLKGRWPKLEKLILNKPVYSFEYVLDAIKMRLRRFECFFDYIERRVYIKKILRFNHE